MKSKKRLKVFKQGWGQKNGEDRVGGSGTEIRHLCKSFIETSKLTSQHSFKQSSNGMALLGWTVSLLQEIS